MREVPDRRGRIQPSIACLRACVPCRVLGRPTQHCRASWRWPCEPETRRGLGKPLATWSGVREGRERRPCTREAPAWRHGTAKTEGEGAAKTKARAPRTTSSSTSPTNTSISGEKAPTPLRPRGTQSLSLHRTSLDGLSSPRLHANTRAFPPLALPPLVSVRWRGWWPPRKTKGGGPGG